MNIDGKEYTIISIMIVVIGVIGDVPTFVEVSQKKVVHIVFSYSQLITAFAQPPHQAFHFGFICCV